MLWENDEKKPKVTSVNNEIRVNYSLNEAPPPPSKRAHCATMAESATRTKSAIILHWQTPKEQLRGAQ